MGQDTIANDVNDPLSASIEDSKAPKPATTSQVMNSGGVNMNLLPTSTSEVMGGMNIDKNMTNSQIEINDQKKALVARTKMGGMFA